MLRCAHCGGRALAGLAHLHGLTDHLCADCTRRALERMGFSATRELTRPRAVIRLRGVRRKRLVA
jgi:hypothetical protein